MLRIVQALRHQPARLTVDELALAEAHSVLPSIPGLPAEQVRQIQQEAFWWTNELRGLITAFARDGVPMIPLKGPAFAERAYGAAHLRSCRDLDLLVQPTSLRAAEMLLARVGFTPSGEGDDYHRSWVRNTTSVELHHNIAIPHTFQFDLSGAWSRAEQGSFAGLPILQFAAADELLYLCLHGARHRFERLSIPLDIHHALRRCRGEVTAELAGQAAAQNLTGALLVGCGLAARLMETSFDEPVWIRPVINELWRRLLSGPPVAWSTPELYRFYVQLERTAVSRNRRRLAHAGVALRRLIPEDFLFAARFGVRGRLGVRVLRVLRLVLRYARPW